MNRNSVKLQADAFLFVMCLIVELHGLYFFILLCSGKTSVTSKGLACLDGSVIMGDKGTKEISE